VEMKTELDKITVELLKSENLINQPFIKAGTVFENPVILNRNDADGQWGVWDQEDAYGTWRVNFAEGKYNLKFRFIRPVPSGGRMMVETKTFISQIKNDAGITDVIEMKNINIPAMDCDFTPFYLSGQRKILPLWVEIEKISITE
jgi:hypothetical protein